MNERILFSLYYLSLDGKVKILELIMILNLK